MLTLTIPTPGTLALAGSLYANELLGKRVDARLRDLEEALA